MRQMWSTHTAMESELQLLWQGMEYTFDWVFWVPEGKQEEEERAEERGVPEEEREEGETME